MTTNHESTPNPPPPASAAPKPDAAPARAALRDAASQSPSGQSGKSGLSRKRLVWGIVGVGTVAAAFTAVLLVGVLYGPETGLWVNYHPVIEGVVYRSAQPHADTLRRFHEQDGIKTVINLRGTWSDKEWYREEKATSQQLGIENHDINLRNFQLPPVNELRRLVDLLDHSPRPILMHCRHGSDRTALASAIAVILFGQDNSLAAARSQYLLLYGHTGLAYGYALPNLLDCYEDWLSEQKRAHSADAFRRWVGELDVLGYFGSKLELDARTVPIAHDRVELVIRATNITQKTWETAEPSAWGSVIPWGADAGIRLITWFELHNPEGQPSRRDHRQRVETPLPRRVASGETATFRVQLPIAEAGTYFVYADLVDGNGIHFENMGPSGLTALVTAEAVTASPAAAAQKSPSIPSQSSPYVKTKHEVLP